MSDMSIQLSGAASGAVPPRVVQGEVELLRRYHGALGEVLVLGLGFALGLVVLFGGVAVVSSPF